MSINSSLVPDQVGDRHSSLLTALVHAGALLPLLLLAWDYTQGQLTANPVREIQLRTGRQTLFLLTLSLACRPVYCYTGFRWALSIRRTLGLYAFAFACLHLLNFVGLDYGFDLALIWEDSSEKRYITAGLATFLVLLALAATSTRGWRERLGRNWGRLHRLVYVAGLLAVLHYLWQVKVMVREPLIYAFVLLVLLAARIRWKKIQD